MALLSCSVVIHSIHRSRVWHPEDAEQGIEVGDRLWSGEHASCAAVSCRHDTTFSFFAPIDISAAAEVNLHCLIAATVDFDHTNKQP